MHVLAVMQRRTLRENVDSAKIKVPIYTTDIDILRVALIHCVVKHLIDVSIHIDGSLLGVARFAEKNRTERARTAVQLKSDNACVIWFVINNT